MLTRGLFHFRSIFDSYTLPKNLSEYPTISVINDNAESMLHGMSIQGIVIEAPIIRQEIAEQVALIWEIEERLTWITDLPGKLPDEIQRLFYNIKVKHAFKNIATSN